MKKLTRKQAIADCIEIWREFAKCGGISKRPVIAKLFEEGKISRDVYDYDCPLCSLYNLENAYHCDCKKCPWPGKGDALNCFNCQCLDGAVNFYDDWKNANTTKERKKAAKNVLRLVQSFV